LVELAETRSLLPICDFRWEADPQSAAEHHICDKPVLCRGPIYPLSQGNWYPGLLVHARVAFEREEWMGDKGNLAKAAVDAALVAANLVSGQPVSDADIFAANQEKQAEERQEKGKQLGKAQNIDRQRPAETRRRYSGG
jgi:hypothetical protein